MKTEKSSGEEEWVSEVQAEAMMQERERREIEEKSMKDFDTGIWNSRGLMELGSRLISQRDRQGLPTSVMFIDIDDMKGLNDRFGHPATTELLKQFANHLTKMVRTEDVAARFGGDEFVLVIASDKEDVPARFNEPFTTEVKGVPVTLTFTAGVVEIDMSHGEGLQLDAQGKLKQAIEKSDDVLMNAKKQNKGKVEIK